MKHENYSLLFEKQSTIHKSNKFDSFNDLADHVDKKNNVVRKMTLI